MLNEKLSRDQIENILSLTSLQQGMLFHTIKDEKSEQYRVQLTLSLSGDVNLVHLQKSWDHVIASNEMLRTVFRWQKIDKPLQIVLKFNPVVIQYHDLSGLEDVGSALQKIKTSDINEWIDITKETLRLYLCKVSSDKYEMIISNHHIIYDGWSNGIIIKELFDNYQLLEKHKTNNINSKTKFSEYIKFLASRDTKKSHLFWSAYLDGIDEITDLFSSVSVREMQSYRYQLGQDFSDQLVNFARCHKFTVSAMLYTAWGLLLQKLTNSSDVLFGTTVSGRPESIKNIDQIVGLFINNIPLRISSDRGETFLKAIQNTEEALSRRKEHENSSLIDIREYGDIPTNHDLFNSIVTIENYPLDLTANGKTSVVIEDYHIYEQNNYNMSLEILLFEGITFQFDFNPNSCDINILNNLGIWMEKILESILKTPHSKISEIELIGEIEKEQILKEFNNIDCEYPKRNIVELFSEQVQRKGNAPAVSYNHIEYSYKKLDEMSNSLARILKEYGVRPEDAVGIIASRMPEMIIAILAILKAGGAYLPIDEDYPAHRISYMLKDSDCKIILTIGKLSSSISFSGQVLDLKDTSLYCGDPSPLNLDIPPENLAYLMYTSGTTGEPKGVMIEQKSIIRLVKNTDFIEFSENDRILQTGSVSFDASTFEIWGALLNGIPLFLTSQETIMMPRKLSAYLSDHKITVLWLTSALFNQISDENPSSFKGLRFLLVGGDVLSPKHINAVRLACPNLEMINGYGPTENTTFSSTFNIKQPYSESIPIGKPIANSTAFVLDSDRNLSPIGVPGELYVGGVGIARGYLHAEKLTQEKFIDSPFSPNSNLYRTGDLVKWLPDGNLSYLGRLDSQVKIRGFRIELPEIENQLLKDPRIKEAAAIVTSGDSLDKIICAYISSDTEIDLEELRNSMKVQLPSYMLPSVVMQIEKMPITLNGKLDQKKLPKPDFSLLRRIFVEPESDFEIRLAKLWSKVLKIPDVSTEDNFFDLGGHSLSATILTSQMQKEFGVEMSLGTFFQHPTIREMAVILNQSENSNYSKIEAVEGGKAHYSVSSAQRRIFTIQQLNLQDTAYNMVSCLEIVGELSLKRTELAFQKLIEKHESLCTSFEMIDGDLYQKINLNVVLSIGTPKTYSALTHMMGDFIRPFDLKRSPLFRVEIQNCQSKQYLLFDMHHIISDGISMSILIHEFAEFYSGKNLQPIKLQYKDFAHWSNAKLESGEMKEQRKYWEDNFQDEIPTLDFPLEYERPITKDSKGNSIFFDIDLNVTKELKRISTEENATIHMILLSALYILLSKYTRQNDIIIGIPVNGRTHPELAKIIGIFVNTLALRNFPTKDKKFLVFLDEVKKNSLKAYENQDYPFELLLENLHISRNQSRNPLFDVMFNLIDTVDMEDIQIKGASLKHIPLQNNSSKFDLTFNVIESEKELHFEINYATSLFQLETISRIGKHLSHILSYISKTPHSKISEIELIGEIEKEQILKEFNNIDCEYPKRNIVELFSEQVQRKGNAPAVSYNHIEYSYKKLDEMSNSLARILKEYGVRPEDAVGIIASRMPEMIIAILAILKAGGAYLPIDEDYPAHRISYMLKDSDCKIILTIGKLSSSISFSGQVLDLKDTSLYCGDPSPLNLDIPPENLAYLMYTSGTTGEPKGVMIEQKSIIRLVKNTDFIEFSENDRILQTGSVSFDASTFEIWGALLNGIPLFLTSQETIMMPRKLSAYLSDHKITVLWLTSALFNQISDENPSSFKGLRFLLVGGDVLSPKHINAVRLACPNLEMINGYGPTENTTFSSTFNIKQPYSESIPIGKPIANSTAFVLDSDRNLSPIGVPGELYVGGVGIARGYLHAEKLTQEKFIDSPFSPNSNLYRTGDLVKWLPDGNLSYLGRLDSQVKIRGFRIELPEIENQLLKDPRIKEAAAIVTSGDSLDKIICAYISSDTEIDLEELRNSMKVQLPSYMLPSVVMQIEKMPITLNGKLDQKKLPKPDFSLLRRIFVEPESDFEIRLAKLWSKVLKIPDVSTEDNFFDLGGHSLSATILTSQMQKEFGVEMSLGTFFQHPTIREMAKYIELSDSSEFTPISVAPQMNFYSVSSSQKRIFIMNSFEKNDLTYNMPVAMKVIGNLDFDKLEASFQKLIHRHSALRTVFELRDKVVTQRILPKVFFNIRSFNDKTAEINFSLKEFVKPFDLAIAPLMRVEITQDINGDSYILIDIHHIISDAVSMDILTRELARIYSGETLSDMKIQYQDFTVWHNDFLKSDSYETQEKYWQDRFSDEIPVTDLHTDFSRPNIQSSRGNTIKKYLPRNVSLQLRKYAIKSNTSMFILLLTAYHLLLVKHTNQHDLIIGSPISGRNHPDTQDLIGVFINMLPLRNQSDFEMTFLELLENIRRNTLKAFDNSDLQFDSLIEKLELQKDYSRNPLFDVSFAYQPDSQKKINLGDCDLEICYDLDYKLSKFDITLDIADIDEQLLLTFEYCSDLFSVATMEKMAEHYINILKTIVIHKDIKLKEIDILSDEEKNKVLYAFNDTAVEYEREKPIHELIRVNSVSRENQTAVVFKGKTITLGALHEKSNKLAHLIRNQGIRRNDIVGIMAKRSPEMIVAILAVLKAGGAYMPIEIDYPEERISYILENSGTFIVLVDDTYDSLVGKDVNILNIKESIAISKEIHAIENQNSSDDLAYVMYTSGSTGKPKGVMLRHRGVVSLSKYYHDNFDFGQGRKMVHMANVAFDAAIVEIFPPLIYGAEIHILEKEQALDRRIFLDFIRKNEINIAQFVPLTMKELLSYDEKPRDLEHVLVAGDKLDDNLKNLILKKGYKLTNHYGPTEGTVDSTVAHCEATETTIGKPVYNNRIYILDIFDMASPIGVAGEICVAGDGLSSGYIGNQSLTNEKFTPNPLNLNEIIYRTGDIGCWLPDGNLSFLGRKDNQIKLRGYRIELEEIEIQLLKNPHIHEVAIVSKTDSNGMLSLCAYFVADKEFSVQELRRHISADLPTFMVPAIFVEMERMPFTTSGKIDKNQLDKSNGRVLESLSYEAPQNEIEEKLAALWQTILNLERVSTEDNFFDLGGHSLSATILTSQMQKEFGVEMSLGTFFQHPTIREMAKYIELSDSSEFTPISVAPQMNFYSVSSSQKRIFIMNSFEKNDLTYNMPVAMKVIGNLDFDKLEASFQKLIHRHSALRTVFELRDKVVTQRILPKVFFNIRSFNDKTAEINFSLKEFVKPFDLAIAPLMRVEITQDINGDSYILIDIHHIISDAVSMDILTRELARIYSGETLSDMKIQYQDFTVWHNDFLKSDSYETQEKYWQDRFSDEIPVTDLHTDFSRPNIQSSRGNTIKKYLPRNVSLQLRKYAIKSNTSMFILLLTAYHLLLVKHTNQHDLIIGSPISGRNHPDTQDLIGVFINMLPLRNQSDFEMTFLELLENIRRNTLKAFDNSDLQFDSLIEKLELQKDYSRNPLFDVSFAYQPDSQKKINLGDCDLEICYDLDYKLSKFDITLDIADIDEQLLLTFEYCSDLFSVATMEKMAEHYINILKTIVIHKDIKLKEIDILSDEEKNKVLYAFNDTAVEYEREKPIHELIRVNSVSRENQTAVVFKGKTITLGALHEKSNKLAHLIRNQGIRRNDIVGIMAKRSPEMIVAILAVLKAGGAYMPIEIDYPEERISYILENSGTFIVLVDDTYDSLVGKDVNILNIKESIAISKEIHAIENQNSSDDLAYVMYTSGSTGKPKGVMLRHRGVVSLSKYYHDNFDFGQGRKMVHMANVAFDAAIVEIFPPLIYGAEIHILEKEQALDRRIFLDFIRKNEINIAQFVPLTMKELLSYDEKPRDLEHVLVAGDKLDDNLKNLILKKGYKLTNHYGPTEGTVDSTVAHCEATETTIGKPVYNNRIYILDIFDMASPIGVAGEICVAGDGLSSGYIGNQSLTNEKFTPNPLNLNEIIYRTGDIGCWLPDGNLSFLGRKDNQIKLRGYRIELEEIEIQLLKNPHIHEVAIVSKTDSNGMLSLCAYFVADKEFSVQELRRHISADLPTFMVPAIFVEMERMPFTTSGKIDKNQLDKSNGRVLESLSYEAPQNEIEEKLAALWQTILNLERVSTEDNFFDLGGHSLSATILTSQMQKEFGVEMSLGTFFQHPTIREMAKYIELSDSSEFTPISVAPQMNFYPVSSSQKRIFIMWMKEKDSIAYNIPSAIMIKGSINIMRVKEVLTGLIKRHESLRTSFHLLQGEIFQKIHSYNEIKLQIMMRDVEETSLEGEINSLVKPFNLQDNSLLRVACLNFAEERHVLFFDVHHVVFDGISSFILSRDFMKLYAGEELPKLKFQYKDYAVWQNQILATPYMDKLKSYWKNEVKSIVETTFPKSFVSSELQSLGKIRSCTIAPLQYHKLQALSRQYKMTGFAFTFSILNIILRSILNQNDLTLGIPVAGRNSSELDDLIGMFLNVLPVNTHIDPFMTFDEYILQKREHLHSILSNQAYPYEEIFEHVKEGVSSENKSLFSILFNYMPYKEDIEMQMEDMQVSYYPIEDIATKYGLTIYFAERENELDIYAVYEDTIDDYSIDLILKRFEKMIELLSTNNQIKIDQLNFSEVTSLPKEIDFDADFDNEDFFNI